MKMKKTCRNCGKRYKDETVKLSAKGKAISDALRALIPKEILEELEEYIKTVADATEDLCPSCTKEAMEFLPEPSEKVKKYFEPF